MKIYLETDAPQGSPQWHALRLGIPTASNAHKFITPAKGELSKQRTDFGHRLIAERILRESFATSVDHLPWIIEGKEREDEAAAAYSVIRDVEVVKVGFVAHDSGRYGCSPDRLVLTDGVRGAAEIKSPTEPVHVGYLIDDGPGTDYKPQMQMQMLVAELEWIDFFSHNPRCPPLLKRFYPDAEFQKKLAAALDQFCDELDEQEARVRKMGLFAPAAKLLSDADRLADMLIADIDRLRGLQEILNREGDAAFVAALGDLPFEQQQRVREAIRANKQLMRSEVL